MTAFRSSKSSPVITAASAGERAAYRENTVMQNTSKKPSLRAYIDNQPFPVTFIGRDAWALDNLIRAGEAGCTPITAPGPRWSHYVWKLRGAGVHVETVDEDHGGPFAGSHARYVLRSSIRIVKEYGVAS